FKAHREPSLHLAKDLSHGFVHRGEAIGTPREDVVERRRICSTFGRLTRLDDNGGTDRIQHHPGVRIARCRDLDAPVLEGYDGSGACGRVTSTNVEPRSENLHPRIGRFDDEWTSFIAHD